MRELLDLLKSAEAVEAMAADLYVRYRGAFAADAEAELLFSQLHHEELSHVALVRYVAVVARSGTVKISPASLSSDALLLLSARLEDELSKPVPSTLGEAVRTALELEVGVGEGYQKTRLAECGPSVARLVAGLAEQDHAERLREFAARRRLL